MRESCAAHSAFGPAGEGHLRLAYTISESEIDRGMDRVEAVTKRLRGLSQDS